MALLLNVEIRNKIEPNVVGSTNSTAGQSMIASRILEEATLNLCVNGPAVNYFFEETHRFF